MSTKKKVESNPTKTEKAAFVFMSKEQANSPSRGSVPTIGAKGQRIWHYLQHAIADIVHTAGGTMSLAALSNELVARGQIELNANNQKRASKALYDLVEFNIVTLKDSTVSLIPDLELDSLIAQVNIEWARVIKERKAAK